MYVNVYCKIIKQLHLHVYLYKWSTTNTRLTAAKRRPHIDLSYFTR